MMTKIAVMMIKLMVVTANLCKLGAYRMDYSNGTEVLANQEPTVGSSRI